MYVYSVPSNHIKSLKCSHKLSSYIIGCILSHDSNSDNDFFHTDRELHTFLTLAFTKLYCVKLDKVKKWDRSTSLSEMYITSFPDFKESLLIFVIINHEKNNCFIITKCALHIYNKELKELNEFENNSHEECLQIVCESYEFVNKIFEKSMSLVKKIETNSNNEKIVEIVEKIQKSPEDDKFNLNNFESL